MKKKTKYTSAILNGSEPTNSGFAMDVDWVRG